MVAVLELCASLQENLGALETAALHSPTKRCQSIPVTSLQIFGGICSYQEVVEQGDMTALSGNMQWATLTQICDVRACSSKQFKALCLPFLHGLEHNFVILVNREVASKPEDKRTSVAINMLPRKNSTARRCSSTCLRPSPAAISSAKQASFLVNCVLARSASMRVISPAATAHNRASPSLSVSGNAFAPAATST
eukprot:m.596801 g.596801  ORF g.596801 m.596801 type:complete len:195 (-) comp58053_c0_seq28:331-915(-)